MPTTLEVIFDGKAFHPEEPVQLKANTRYVVTIERELVEKRRAESAQEEPYPLSTIGALATDMGVSDLAARHDDYAHGRLKSEPDAD